jgi:hypothetical protein
MVAVTGFQVTPHSVQMHGMVHRGIVDKGDTQPFTIFEL